MLQCFEWLNEKPEFRKDVVVCPKDSTHTGYGIIVKIEEDTEHNLETLYTVLTDFGNVIRFTVAEMGEVYTPVGVEDDPVGRSMDIMDNHKTALKDFYGVEI